MTPAVASCRSRSQSSQIIIIIILQSRVVLRHHPQVNMEEGGQGMEEGAVGAGNNKEISNDHLNPSTSSQSSGLKRVRLLGREAEERGMDKSKLSCVPCDDAQNENSNP